MPVAGNIAKTGFVGGSHVKDVMTPYVQSFIETAENVLNESQFDIFEEPKKVFRRTQSKEALKEFFCNQFLDEQSTDPLLSDPEYVEDQYAMMEQQFENDVSAIYEHSVLADYNPIIGMTFPVHKNILMNMVFDKGAIQKVVAIAPKFTYTMERRLLVDANGNEIDMFTEQNKMTEAIDASNPVYDIVLTLPENETTNVVQQCGGTNLDSLSVETYVSAIQLDSVYVAEGDPLPDADGFIRPNNPKATAADAKAYTNVWIPVVIKFHPSYDPMYDRTFNQKIKLTVKTDATTTVTINDTLNGTMNKGYFTMAVNGGANSKIKKVMLSTKLDTSNAMLDTCSVKWDTTTTIVEIPTATPLNVTISPEEVKDLAALYQVNQLTKIMSMLKTVLANYKDDKIKQFLEKSYDNLPSFARGYFEFDFAPPAGSSYALTPLEWRHSMFFEEFDTEVTKMLQVLNDPNMIVTCFGDPDIIRRIVPTEYTYVTPNTIGPVELDFKRTVCTSDKRVYQFIGTDKMRWNDDIRIILTPRNSNRVTYRIYDYQMYVSNEIRNIQNPALPAVHAFERFLCDEYQPVQSVCRVLNRSGLRN